MPPNRNFCLSAAIFAAMENNRLEKLVSTYRRNPSNAELEARLEINEQIFKQIFAFLNKSSEHTVSQTIAIISPLDRPFANRVCYLSYDNEKQVSRQCIEKSSIMPPVHINTSSMQYRVALSKEVKTDQFDVGNAKLGRLRIRFTWEIGSWRHDLTLVKRLNKRPEEVVATFIERISEYRKLLFRVGGPSKKFTNPLQELDLSLIDSFEFEIEYIGHPFNIDSAEILASMDNVLLSIDDSALEKRQLQEVVYRVAQKIIPKFMLSRFVHKMGLKNLSNNAKELNRSQYYSEVFAQVDNYYVTEKADGEHGFVMVEGNKLYTISSSLETRELGDAHPVYILDVEIVDGTYYVFDVLIFGGEELIHRDFEERVEFLQKIPQLSAQLGYPKLLIPKSMLRLQKSKLQETLVQVYKKNKYNYPIDGLIFTEARNSVSGRTRASKYASTRTWKWKPIEDSTIDFLIREAPKELRGKIPYISKPKHTTYILFSGIRKKTFEEQKLIPIRGYNSLFGKKILEKDYFPIQFSPASNPFAHIFYSPQQLDNRIGEFRYNVAEQCWILNRIRDDRAIDLEKEIYFGNTFTVAELIWQKYSNPLNFADLYTEPESYFAIHDNELYKAQRIYASFVKNQSLEDIRDTELVVDLASGKGQDLRRYAALGIGTAVFVEKDRDALEILVERKSTMNRAGETHAMKSLVVQADLTQAFAETLEKIEALKLGAQAGAVVCNLAIHYFTYSTSAVDNFVALVKSLLKKGGTFIFTCMNGADITDLFSETPKWSYEEGGRVKYAITKKYKSDTLASTGQKISVLLPFSNTMYEEYLVNVDYVVQKFTKAGFLCVYSRSYTYYSAAFADAQPDVQLSEGDKKYIGLYRVVKLKRAK